MITDKEYTSLQRHIDMLISAVESYQEPIIGRQKLRDSVHSSVFTENVYDELYSTRYLNSYYNTAYILMLNDVSKEEIQSMTHAEGLAYIWLLIA